MDEIPLPDDIPTPDEEVFSALIVEEPENIEIIEYVTDVEIESTVVSESANNQDDFATDMDIQANTPEACMEPSGNTSEFVQSLQTRDNDVSGEHTEHIQPEGEPDQSFTVGLVNNQIVEGPAPAPKNFVPPEPEPPVPATNETPAKNVQSERPSAPTLQNAPTPVVDPMMQTAQTTAVDPMMQNAQMQYSAANYMYQQHMTDPNMMSNYSYMTGNYSDYMSMYNPMQQQQYANTYASYQNYNYAYPAMQQMYDGRNMAQYAGNYPTQMLPTATPPLPSAQPVNNFNPPLPSEMSATAFPKVPATPKTNVDSKKPLQVKKDDKETIEKPVIEDSTEVKTTTSPTETTKEEMDKEPDAVADAETDAAQTNPVSEDVNRYSPSLPMDEDESNNQTVDAESGSQNRASLKPSSVLGIAQAKKRLMAFSISKQAAAAKKQAQEMAASVTTTKSKKENGEVGQDEGNHNPETNVFDDKHSKKKIKKIVQKEKARETMEEIEELKRTEMFTGPNNVALYRQTLMNELNNQDSKRDGSRRRSRSNSRRRRHSRSRSPRGRKSRRYSRKYRNSSRSRSRSRSKSRSRSGSPDKRRTVKTTDIKSWDDFIESGFQLDRYRRIKFKENGNFLESEVERRKKELKQRHRRSRSSERRSASIEKEVVLESREKKVNFLELPMELKQPLVVVRDSARDSSHSRASNDNQEETVEFPSHMMQYTETKPVLRYCENPKYATLHFISRTELLETVPEDVTVLMNRFWSSIRPKKLKKKQATKEGVHDGEMESSKSHSIEWFSKSPLFEIFPASEDDAEYDDEDPIVRSQSSTLTSHIPMEEGPTKPVERTRTRKSRFEEATDNNQQGVSLVVRSRWDSDYEDESPEKLSHSKISEPNDSSLPTSSNEPIHGLNESFTRVYEGPAYPPKKTAPIETDVEENATKVHDSEEKSSRKQKEKRRRDDRTTESRKSKSRFDSAEPELKTSSNDDYAHKNTTDSNSAKSGEHKLVSEYEEFLKMVNFEPSKEETSAPLYEGPKPPPRWNRKSEEDANENTTTSVTKQLPEEEKHHPFVGSDDEKDKMEVDEYNFDIDSFFVKEKEKKMQRLSAARVAATEMQVNEPVKEASKEPIDKDLPNESDKSERKHEKKEKEKDKKKRKAASFKTKKRDTKKKRKTEKKKKKKGSDSSSGSSDSESESDSKRGSDSDSSTSSSSSSRSSSSSSSDDNSSDSTLKKKRRRTKKTKKKDKKRGKSVTDKHKKKKRKKMKDSESDDKKKKSKSYDAKKSKNRRKSSENFLDLIEKSLAVKKPENESPSKKTSKEKHKKRRKKHEKDKKGRMKALDISEDTKNASTNEDVDVPKRASSEESASDMRRKKKKQKKKKEGIEVSGDEANTSGWKRKKIDLRELEENVNKAEMNAFLEDSPSDSKMEREASVTKAQSNSFFEEDLDDWDKSSTAIPVVANSMRDDPKNEKTDDPKNEKTDDVKDKKKKKKRKNEKHKNEKSKTDDIKEKKKDKGSRKKKKTKKRRKHDDDKERSKDDVPKEVGMDLDDIPLPGCNSSAILEKENSVTPPPKRTFDQWEEECAEHNQSSKRDSDQMSLENSGDSFTNLANSSNQSAVNISERYSPTACDAEDDDMSATPKPPSPKEPSTPSNENIFPLYSQFMNSYSMVTPSPVPAPSPVPPPTIQPTLTLTEKPPPKVAEPAADVSEDSPESSDKNTDASLGACKSFSIGKKEFRTKAAMKFFSNNVFETLEDMEKNDAEMMAQAETDDIPKEKDPKEAVDRLSPPVDDERRERSDSRDRSKPERSNERYRSSSRDRNRRRYRYDRDTSHDKYRRRSRSRDRYNKKYSYRDSYRRRSRSRSRSRNRRRSRDREYYRHRRRSFSNEREIDRDRKHTPPPYEKSRKGNDVDDTERQNVEYDHSRRDDEQRYNDENRVRNTMNVIQEITRSVREMSANATMKGSNPDLQVLQDNLIQLKETLQNLNKQGVPLDSLHNVLAVLENSKLGQSQSEFESVNREKIMSVCQAIHNNLPSTPEKKFGPYGARSPPEPPDANVSMRTKRNLVDSTNSGYKKSRNRFETRSREISPKPLSLDERLELEFELKRNTAPPPSIPPPNAPINMNAAVPYYPGVPVFDGRTNFPATLPIPNYPPPMINCGAQDSVRNFYRPPTAPATPLNWTKIPPPMIMQRIPPPCAIRPPTDPAVNKMQQPYRVPDPTSSKVHSIQVGNVLQIVPTELQASASSQKVPSSQVPVVSSSPSMPTSQPISSVPMNPGVNVTGFSSLLSAHLPSFATAPAVSGAKPSAPVSRPNNETPIKEKKLVPNDPRHKIKELQSQPPPPPVATPPAGSKIINLPLPPGISDAEIKKLMRLTKEKRKEEKALQNMLKGKTVRASPLTPTSDENCLLDELSMDEHGEHSVMHIKPSPEQGILISPGFKEKSTPVTALGRSIIGSTRKAVSFVDGVRPGSANDSPPTKTRRPSPPPLSPLSAPKKKHKVRVKIIRPDDSDDDDEAPPPPPPPGRPPPELALGALGVLPPGFVLPKL